MSFPLLPPLEMWGGLECTLNRVGDTYFDQLERNGHVNRPSDLYRFAELGIRTLRYPIQWERIAPHGIAQIDWSWADERLNILRKLRINPIVGLTHHGSGPRHTSLVEPSFAKELAQFAAAVAQRYPWIDYYTPVNEPLTTARFSGLYGHWYPHGQDQTTFVQALLTQCRAIVLSMQAIRRINPSAQLIQTEDLGKVFSTPLLIDQANWENERRWLTFDLLCGYLNHEHVMWDFMIMSGADKKDLEWFLEHPCPPNILGIDYYLTSERFLDEHLDAYPANVQASNGTYKYADVEAVRVNTGRSLPVGHYERMREAWERYQLPLAITEVHLGCTREEQLRWLVESWNAAQTLRKEGAQVRAVTAWALLGAYDWNNLVTRMTHFYEPGIFDVRGPHPRPTAIAQLVHTLASGNQPDHPVLAQPGWWKRPDRFFYQSYPEPEAPTTVIPQENKPRGQERPLLIIETTDGLGKAFARSCTVRCLPYQIMTQHQIGRHNAFSIHRTFENLNPWAVIYLAHIDTPIQDRNIKSESLDRKQTWEATLLADVCAQRNISLVAFSSDLVFDGSQQMPYMESDPTTPTCTLGYLQAEIEELILQRCPSALMIRIGPLFGPWENFDFLTSAYIVERCSLSMGSQSIVSPTYVPDMVEACLDLLIDGERGRWHLTNSGTLSWTDFIRRIADSAKLKVPNSPDEITLTRSLASPHIVCRVLRSEHGQLLPSLDDAFSRYFRDFKGKGEQEQPVA